ncbi:MAG: hypothetical protein HOI95_11670 [Chromatiales bacterium]|jgi:hypothetical protein|nr:hypothetical protein [Chromatiales bacterium]
MMIQLSDEQRTQWAIDGYLHLKGVIDPDEVKFLSAELDRIRAVPGYEPAPGDLPRGHYKWSPGALDQDVEGFMDRRDLLSYGKPFIDLVDRPHVFDLIVDIMGPYLLHSMSQAIVRASTDQFPGYTHTDGGEALRRIRVTETSLPLAMKAMYLLSDVTGQDSGNFTVFPGSHMRPFPENAEEYLNPHAPGAVQLGGKAGDCYLFAHSLWHGPAPNHSGAARKTLLYNYCQMFVRWYDHAFPADVLEQCTPRQRRLLGDLGYDFRPGSYFYAPTDQKEVIAATPAIA